MFFASSCYHLIVTSFAIAFAIFFMQGCSRSSYKSAITSVLEQDKRASEGITSYAEYVVNQNKINLSDCPDDFKKAYLKHKNAWMGRADVEKELLLFKKMYVSDEAKLEAFLRGSAYDYGMLGEVKEAAERIKAHENQADKEVRDTFIEVLNIAVDYGVDIEPYSH